MDIRTCTPYDLKQVVRLANQYASFDSDVIEADFQPGISFPQGFLVATDNDSIIGFIFSYIREVPIPVLIRWGASKVVQIELLVVDPSHRKKGIGTSLLDNLFETLRIEGVDYVNLTCPVEAQEAKHLYDKFGFEVRAYTMKKRL
ncbi:MAG: GNAT family N-acetyltransferase [Candidatus Thorarchaeota archaeon]